jgi:hypothetical protein
MDEIDQLIEAFGSRGKTGHAAWKLDLLMDIGRFRGARVTAFFAAVVADEGEPPDVRADALRRLRESTLTPSERALAAEAGLRALACSPSLDLRLHAALALGDFADLPATLQALGALAADADEPLELRYNAFTSLQRAGPTPDCLALLRGLVSDETLGQSAAALLASWGAR